jgi:hypothetical protein
LGGIKPREVGPMQRFARNPPSILK